MSWRAQFEDSSRAKLVSRGKSWKAREELSEELSEEVSEELSEEVNEEDE